MANTEIPIAEPKGKLGVMTVGLGAVATTMIAGVAAGVWPAPRADPIRWKLGQRHVGVVEDQERRIGDDGDFTTGEGREQRQNRRRQRAALMPVEREQAERYGRSQARLLAGLGGR